MSLELSAKTPVSVVGRWKKRFLRGRHFICFAGCWAFATGAVAAVSVERTIEVRPTHLLLNAMLNEPVVFQIEITTADQLGEVDLKVDGFRIQREIRTPAPNRRLFFIEPDTSVVGRMSGSIGVIDAQGRTLGVVPVTGDVKPYVRVSPSRIFLGSLEYGATSERIIERTFRLSSARDWDIKSVSVSDIADAVCELKDLDSKTKELRLRFPEESFKAGEPFGAFVRRAIRITTNIPEQLEVSIPMTAILSKNGTDRDFRAFVFRGKERWQGFWGTPNLAGAVIGPLILLAVGYGTWLWPSKSRAWNLMRSVSMALWIAAGVGMVILVKTYSRGGWVAFGVGLAAMMVLMKGYRRGLVLALLGFVLIVGALPAGIERVASAGKVVEDLSIRNRLLVWRGALEMIADHPMSGVGTGRFGQVFQDYYQEPWHQASYTSAVNDYLTFAAERGFVRISLLILAGVFLVTFSLQVMRRHGDAWLAPLLGGLGAIAASALFSSIASVMEIRILAFAGAGILAAYCGIRVSLAHADGQMNWRAAVRSFGGRGAITAFLAVGLIGGWILWAERTRPVRHVIGKATSMPGSSDSLIEYSPGVLPVRGTVLYLPEENESLRIVGRQILRPLAQNGWRAMALELPSYDQEAIVAIEQLIRNVRGPLTILAERRRSRVAVAAAKSVPQSRRPGLALIAPVMFSALPECDQSSQLMKTAPNYAIIEIAEWEAFRKDGRNRGSAVFETLARSAATPNTEEGVGASDRAGHLAETLLQ